MVAIAKQNRRTGQVKDFTEEELTDLYDIRPRSLKFFLLRVDPKRKWYSTRKKVLISWFHRPFIQYTHARIKAF